jgi:hypothetical protein
MYIIAIKRKKTRKSIDIEIKTKKAKQRITFFGD